jgi:hypothetical protein
MQPETNHTAPADPNRGLPPVVPPTGRFIAQLFVVPGLIVAFVVALLLGANWLMGGARTPEQFLQNLDNPNPEVRWRAADDLAQVLLRDERLASDPRFALDLSVRLRRALEAAAPAEQDYAERMHKDPVAENDPGRKKLDADRAYIHYLMACLSDFIVPAGMPALKDLAEKPDVAAQADAQAARRPEATWASRRPEAVWALGKLGENVHRFAAFPPERQQAVLDYLKEEAEGVDTERAEAAKAAVSLLAPPEGDRPRLLGLDAVFDHCASDGDPFLREMTALALNFWQGSPAENARLDGILSRLAQTPDDGESSTQAREVRYNAAVALARRGSARARLDLLQEMLDEERQRQNFRLPAKDGHDAADEATAQTTVLNALKATAEVHRLRPDQDLSSLYPAVERLAHSPAVPLRNEADRTLAALGRK